MEPVYIIGEKEWTITALRQEINTFFINQKDEIKEKNFLFKKLVLKILPIIYCIICDNKITYHHNHL